MFLGRPTTISGRQADMNGTHRVLHVNLPATIQRRLPALRRGPSQSRMASKAPAIPVPRGRDKCSVRQCRALRPVENQIGG